MRWKTAISIGLLALCSMAQAKEDISNHSNRLAVQGLITTGGNVGFGLVDYTNWSEIGATIAVEINNAHKQTKLFTPAVFAGLRKPIGEQTYFAYGIDLASTLGQDTGKNIDSDIQVGPYISLEQALTSHLLLIGFIEPYSYEYQKKAGVCTSTHRVFSSGGLAMSYLF